MFVAIRPARPLSCEHMFPSAPSTFAQRALGALRLTRSFLTLEDDYDVDWEVGCNELEPPVHPHRVPLRGGALPRRAGRPAPVHHDCLCPLGNRPAPIAEARLFAGASRPSQHGARTCAPEGAPLCRG